jgi:hypothetical protein
VRASEQVFEQIAPAWIRSFDHLQFPDAIPFLDLTLAHESRVTRFVHFEPDQRGAAILGGKAFEQFVAVLGGSQDDVVGRAGVERAVPLTGMM